ncbi:MAG TPA: hypothetical protein VGI26_06820 [Solirubrobacteraceae bacterium]|jgi:hypothetical protein
MAFITLRASGVWEIRESHTTPSGPRSRTLATFKTLTPEVIAHAQARAERSLDADELRQAARRVGAPVEPPAGERAVSELLTEIAAGRRPRPALARLLLEALQGGETAPSSNAQAAAVWIGASPRKRGDTLRDLLLLVDHLPRRERREQPRFPRIQSQVA